MKFVIQKVLSANVKVDNKIVGEIEKGILVLIGFGHNDNKQNIPFAVNKLLSLRLWDDENGKRWSKSIKDLSYGVLLVSQFTLHATLKGNKPDFHNAMDPKIANELYDEFLCQLKSKHKGNVSSGKFGELMAVSLVNNGPVTIEWEYPNKEITKEDNKNTNSNTKKLSNFENDVIDKNVEINKNINI